MTKKKETVNTFTNINSSVIDGVSFDSKKRSLSVQLKGGRVYQYRNVSPKVFTEFLNAKSKGNFFNERIVGEYESVRVS